MLYTSPSKSSSSHRISPIPGGRLRAKNWTFPENQVLDPIRCLAAFQPDWLFLPRLFAAKC